MTFPADGIDLSMYERFLSSTSGIQVAGGLALTTETRSAEGLIDSVATIGAGVDFDEPLEGLTPRIVDGMLRRADGRFRRLTLRAEQSPLADSRVQLSTTEVDALGLPRTELDWRVSQEDRVAYARTLRILSEELAASGLGRGYVPYGDDDTLDWSVLPGAHHMGTTRMGTNPERSVVDVDGKAHDLGNLYLAGSSVFPTGGSANPTLTIVALALRLADHLGAL